MGTVEWQRVVDLTQIMDRRNGKDRLAELIELARQEQKMLTVVFYDINGLHLINDTYGHHEGDNLLLYVSKIIVEGLTEPDLLFRLSEDEFILALYDETEDGAAERMEKALELLEKKREQFGIYYDASFCYGVTAVYPSDKFSVNEIITRADERMYIQKRNFHIDRAGMRLRRNTERGRTAPGFDYNREFLYEALASSRQAYSGIPRPWWKNSGCPVRSWRMLPPYGAYLSIPKIKRDSWRVTRILPTAEWSTIILNTGPETFSESGAGCGAAAGWCGIMRGNRNILPVLLPTWERKT